MKALSIHAQYATQIAANAKTIEARSWPTNYKGDILICSTVKDRTKKGYKDKYVFGHAVAVANLSLCERFRENHKIKAQIKRNVRMDGMYAWHLTNIRPIKPIPVKGQQRIYNTNIDYSDLEFIDVKNEKELYNYWKNNSFIS